VNIQTDPSGADVYLRAYDSDENDWEYLGRTPLDSTRIPRGFFRWKIEKEGFVRFEDADNGTQLDQIRLDRMGSIPDGMVRVPGGEGTILVIGIGYQDCRLSDYLIDKYEVTHRHFKMFVDGGGYENSEFWRHEFVVGGKMLTWEEAMALFRDTTGRPGPATWELGTFPDGEGDYPVGGVSWFEAAAYAEFAGKKLPTFYHWRWAAATRYPEYIIPHSNFGEDGPAPVGHHAGLNYFGTYDMAGNVREWCFNYLNENRSILGGAWDDPYYMFYLQDAKSPFDRSPGNGFRCVKYLDSESSSETVERPIVISIRDYSRAKPVSESVFEIYAGLYSYDKTDLNPAIEWIDESSEFWRKEKISFDAAYGNERMSAYLFLPRNTQPPYQTIIIFPGASMFRRQSSENGDDLLSWYAVDFVIKSGRAVFYPIYQSAYERYDGYEFWQAFDEQSAYRDRVIQWSKDLSRSIDYLETRSEIDHEKLCYAGSSWGSAIAPMLLTMENRIKVCYLVIGGFWFMEMPPEVDQFNFTSRIKIPVLMLNGRYDELYDFETSQVPMFNTFGTPDTHKRHRLFEVGHNDPKPRNEFIREVLDWLDRYLGEVK
jgi:cephalosporin-C deacetylase-like acetyl esterase